MDTGWTRHYLPKGRLSAVHRIVEGRSGEVEREVVGWRSFGAEKEEGGVS